MDEKKNVIDLSHHRKEKQELIRREYERFVFASFVGCYLVMCSEEMNMIYPIDISMTGMKFNISKKILLNNNQSYILRMYFTNNYFIDNEVKIIRSLLEKVNGIEERNYACQFDVKYKGYETIEKLVSLIEGLSRNAEQSKTERLGY